MLITILLIVMGQLPVVICHGDRVCVRANEFSGRYSEWAHVANASKPNVIDAKEPVAWNRVESAFKKLRHERMELR